MIKEHIEIKICIKCKIPKNIKEFYVDRRLKDGHLGRCKECARLWVESKEVKERRVKQHSGYIKKAKELLTDNYVIRQLCHHTDLTPDDIRKFPELIKAKRQIIKTNRIIKNHKNEEKNENQDSIRT